MTALSSEMQPPDATASLSEWTDWLLHLHAQEIDLGIERVKTVAERLGVQQPGIKNGAQVISVSGTNGKGSSVAMLASIYQAAGYQVGTYTSPHILRFNERFKINGKEVADQEIVEAFVAIESARQEIKLTFFEFATLAALVIFASQPLDVIVLEVGLGGRLDAVNLVDADAALITAIDVDHVDWLGSDRNQIAVEKLGIARSNRLCVTSDPDFPQLAQQKAIENEIPLQQIETDFFYQIVASENDQTWCFWLADSVEKAVLPFPALKGRFQLQNAAGVLALIAGLHKTLPVAPSALKIGLERVSHQGRLQAFVHQGQQWLVDVAHNPQSAKVLADYLASIEFEGPAVFSVLADKDALPMVKLLMPFISHWHLADLSVPRSTSVEGLKSLLSQAGVAADKVSAYGSVAEAVSAVQAEPVLESGCLAWGSFFTVSQVLAALEG